MKELSFIIPMYNAEPYIGACIDSILNQGFEKDKIEIVVVDDGSKDNGKDVVQKYDCVKYIYQENQGQSAARNKGIEVASGEFLCFVDADDILVPNSYKFCLDYAKEMNLDVMTFNILRCNEDELKTKQYRQSQDVETVTTGIDYIATHAFNNGAWWYLLKKDMLGSLRFVRGRYGEDGMFTMELLMKARRITYVDRHCYYYMFRPCSITTRRDISHMKKMIDDYLFVYHYMQDLIHEKSDSLTPAAFKRCDDRSKSYLFFMLIRLMKYPHASALIEDTIKTMKKEGIYPVQRPYSGIIFTTATLVVNRPWLLKLSNFVFTHLKR